MQFIFLTQDFYNDFQNLKEVEMKQDRPYVLLLISYNNYDFGIPLRSKISHPNCYKTYETSGVDYSKAVIIPDRKYIDTNRKPIIRNDDFKALKGKDKVIEKQFVKYIREYIKAYDKMQTGLEKNRDKLLVNFSTLQNYHKELNIGF